jgi:hypothetical protein
MPLHLLDNLSNLTDPASARSVLGLGVVNSPQFASLTTTGIISSAGPITADSTVTVWRGGGQENTNTAVGYQSLCSNSIGNNNIANGYQALYYNDTGSSNTAIGNAALFFNTDGSNNTAIGSTALINNTLGSGNIATGVTALANNTTGNNNVATGQNTLYNNAIGSYNVAIGDATLYYIAIGDNNTAIGSSAGNTISGGAINDIADTSIYLGANTKALSSGQTNQIVIGYDATGIGSNTVTLGNDSIITTALKGNVGIGTTSPNATLTVNGTLSAGNTYLNSLVLNDGLSANRINSPEYDVTGTDGMVVASKSVLGWAFTNTTTPVLTADTSPQAVFFKPDGSQMYVLGSGTTTTYRVYAYNVPTPWNVSTVSATPTLSSGLIESSMQGLYFSPDGRYFFTLSSASRILRRFTMSVGSEWDVSTGVASGTFTFPSVSPAMTQLRGITFKPDGTKLYVVEDNTNFVYEYDLNPAWDVTTAVRPAGNPSLSLPDGGADISISSDGKRIIIITSSNGTFTNLVWEYMLPTAWSLVNGFLHGNMAKQTITSSTIGGPIVSENTATGIYFNDVVGKCFFVGSGTDRVQEIDITPQLAIVGDRPIIFSPVANSARSRVTMNSLQITETGAAALFVNGGISLPDTAITWTGGGSQRISGFSGRITFGSGTTEWGRFSGAQFRCANFQVGAGADSGTAAITSPAAGVLTLGNSATTDFNRLQFGGVVPGFPAIKRNGTGIDIRDAADSGYTSLAAGNFVVNNNISIRTDDFTLSGIDAGKYTRLAKLSGTQTIALTGSDILTGHEFTFYRATSAAIALNGGIVNGGVNISSVSQNAAFGLKHLGSGIFDFI